MRPGIRLNKFFVESGVFKRKRLDDAAKIIYNGMKVQPLVVGSAKNESNSWSDYD